MKKNISQTSLELAVVLASIAIFFVGVTRIWVWSNAQIVGRTPGYRASRLQSGSTNPGFWGDSGEGVYTPKELTEQWVFSGNASGGSGGNINYPGLATGGLGFFGHGYTDEELGGLGGRPIFNFNIDLDDYDIDDTSCDELAALETELIAKRAEVVAYRPDIQAERDIWAAHLATAKLEVQRLANTGTVNITCWNYRNYCGACPACTCAPGGGGWGGCIYADMLCVKNNCSVSLNTQYRDGWIEVPFSCSYGAGGNEDCCTGIAYGTPCYNGCTACGTASCCSQCFTITSPYTSRTKMAEDYYYFYLITSGFTMNITARRWFYDNDPRYKFFDNPYGSSCYCSGGWGSGGGCGKPTYYPGLLDWQEREAYAQARYDELQGALDSIDQAVTDIDTILADIDARQVQLGC